MSTPSTAWFKNFWMTSNSLDFDVLFTGYTIPGELLQKCFWFSFLERSLTCAPQNHFVNQINFWKVWMTVALPSKPIHYSRPNVDTVSNAAFVEAVCLSALQCRSSFDNFQQTSWVEPKGKDKFLHKIIGRFPEAQRLTQADRQVTQGVKYAVIQSDFCANLYKAMIVSLRHNSLNKQLRSNSTLSIQIYLKIPLLQIL